MTTRIRNKYARPIDPLVHTGLALKRGRSRTTLLRQLGICRDHIKELRRSDKKMRETFALVWELKLSPEQDPKVIRRLRKAAKKLGL